MSYDVLLIEDEPVLRDLIQLNLEQRGIAVATAATGWEGLDMIQSGLPRIILLDVRLPDIDGWEVCSRIQEQKTDTYSPVVIFLTAAVQERDRLRAQELGAGGFIAKPFDIPDLVNEVKKLLHVASSGGT